MTSSRPLVSVVMPVYNTERYLAQSTGSALRQSLPDFELLAVDDGSSDGSPEWLAGLSDQDARVSVLQTVSHRGAAEARNLALARARGRFIAFLDADDVWLENKLERQLAFMKEHRAYFSYTAYEKINGDGERFQRRVHVPARLDYATLLKGCPVGCSTVMIDTERTGPVGMPSMRRSQDYACWLDLVRRHGPALGLNEVLTLYRQHAGSLSANKLSKLRAAWRIYRRQESLSWPRASASLAAYASHGLRKRLI